MAVWLIVAAVVVLVVGPALFLLPSPRERQVTRLRQRAMGQGVLVKLTQLPHPDPSPEDRVSAGGEVRTPVVDTVAYRLQVRQDGGPRQDPNRAPAFRIDRVAQRPSPDLPDGWRWGDVSRAPASPFLAAFLPLLAQLPDSTHAVEIYPEAVAVMWRERGDESRVDALVQSLLAMADLVRLQMQPPPADDNTLV